METKMMHTAEPWHIKTLDGSRWGIDDANDNAVAQSQQIIGDTLKQDIRDANAARIVACVNALAGLDIEYINAVYAARTESDARITLELCRDTERTLLYKLAQKATELTTLRDQVKALEAEMDAAVKWVSVEDRLPEEGLVVLICVPAWRPVSDTGYFVADQWIDSNNDILRGQLSPTHWMPMPPLPPQT